MGPFGLIWVPEAFDLPGTVDFTTVGAANFTVPKYGNTLTIQLHGGGAGGTGRSSTTSYPGTNGSASTITSLSLNAGGGNATGVGGTASGGDTNTPGRNTVNTFNEDPRSQNNGWWPGNGNIGAGGKGDWVSNTKTPQGGTGGYVVKTYTQGQLTPNAILALMVGAGGNGGTDGGGNGIRGQITITWS